jgi:hypothetical protein
MKFKKLHFCLLLIAYCFSSQAQIYPVQVNSSLVPPYLTTVSDYSTSLNEKFVANLFTNDLTIVNRQVQLKLYIEGNNLQAVSTPVINNYAPLYINGGESLRLTNVDLAPYFQLENLQGINPAVYAGTLPQGLYKFCIEVYDYNTQIKISQKSCAMAYFIVNDPPFLNLPSNHENIPSQDPQNIIFTWTPRHLNATNIEYEYTLVELQDNLAPTNYAFLVTQPLLKVVTNNTILLYGPTEPLLIPGKKYAWRVQARSQPGFGDAAAFQNNGYSEIYDFVFQGNCDKPTFVLAEALSNSQVKITWQANPNHLNYLVQYRKKGTTTWFDVQSNSNEVKLYDLEPLAVYEYRVGGYCAGNVVSFSNTNEFTQPNSNINAINCGILPTIDLTNQTLYNGNLVDGQVFTAGDFPIHVTEASGTGSYTGKGWTKAPYLNSIRLAVVFENIKLNSDLKLLQGEVKAVYDPSWGNIVDINTIVDQVENVLDNFQQSADVHTEFVNFPIGNASNITLVNGQIVVVNPETGQTGAIFDHDQGETTTITDSTGSVYTVGPNGQISQQGVGIGIPNASNTENVSASGQATALSNVGIKVVFKRSTISGKESIAADDNGVSSSAPAKLKALYKTIKDAQNNDYPLYYKAIVNKEDGNVAYEYVKAEIEITDNTIKLDSLVFNKKGIKVEAVDASTEGGKIIKILKVPAFTTVGEDQVLALLKNGKQKQKVVGAMVGVAIKDVGEVNITLVPVNNAAIPADIESQLNAIYAGTGVRLKVTTSVGYISDKTTMACGDSGWFTNYTEDQKAFINAYKTSRSPKDNEYYLFVTKNITPSRSLSGFMPLHQQFGFVFSEQTTGAEAKQGGTSGIAAVIAHELGHGVFELEHPWERYTYTKGTGSTPWLMDYDSGTQLSYTYWQTISHPKNGLYLFQNDNSGELVKGQNYFTPAGLPFYAKENAKTTLYSSDIENGSKLNGLIYGFTTIEGKEYEAKIENNKFYGYRLVGTETFYVDETNFALGLKIKVKSVNYIGNCQVEFYLRDYVLNRNINNQTYINGVEVISSFNSTSGKKIGDVVIIDNCNIDYDSPLTSGVGKQMYDNYKSLININDTEALNELKKIGNLINKLGADLYNSHKQAVVWNNNIDSNVFALFHYKTPTPLWNKATLQDTFLSIKKYYDAVIKFRLLTTNGNFTTTQIKEIVNQNFVCCNSIKYLFQAPFEELGENQRNNLLKVFLNDNWLNGRLSIADDLQNEDIILNTITTTKNSNQHKAILNFLKREGLIYKIIKKVNGDNYDAITTTLTKWIIEEFPVTNIDLNKLLVENKLIHFNDDYFGRKNTEQILQNNEIVLKVKKWFGNTEYDVRCAPYEYIEVTFQNDFTLGTGNSAATFVKNTPYKLPALYVYMLFNSDTKAKWMTSGKIAVDVLLLAVGVGEIRAAIKSGQWATASLAVADLGIGFGDIVINTAFKNEIQTNYPKFFETWQKISLCYGIGRIAQVGLTAAYNRCYVESQIIKNKTTYTQSTKGTAQQIEGKLQDPANFAEFIDQPVLANELTFFTNLDNNYPSVTKKIGLMDDETRLVFYSEFKNNPNSALQNFESNPGQLDNWIQSRIVAGRFIASSGIELRIHLNTIVNRPTGETYAGDFYRSLSKSSEINHGALPNLMTDHHIYSSWGRYDLPGEENAMYLSKKLSENQTELVPHYGAWNDFSTYKYESIQVNNLLDITDDVVRQQLGTEFQQLVKISDDPNSQVAKSIMYEYTNEIGKWARQNGYNGLIVPGARGTQNYENIILFEQTYINQVLQGKIALPIIK